MGKERDLEIEIKRILTDADQKWDYSLINEIEKNMNRALSFMDQKYSSNEEINMLEVLNEYQQDKEEHQRKNTLNSGYFFVMEVVNAFVKKPEIVWEIYDKTQNKNDFFERSEFEYSFGKDENLYAFSREVLSSIFLDNKLSIEDVAKFTKEQREKYIKSVHKYFEEKFKPNQEKTEKQNLLDNLKNTLEELERLGALEASRKLHNEKMNRAGADVLMISEGVQSIDDNGIFYGCDLEKLSIFKLQAMLAFYLNRLEKVKENIGLGMFLVTAFSKKEDFYKSSLKNLDKTDLKEVWKRFYTMSRILDDEMDVIYDIAAKRTADGNRTELLVSEVYDAIMKKYSKVWKRTFGDVDMKDEFFIFMTTNGFSKRNHYILKDELIEELLVQCANENINWGIIDESESNKPILSKRILIGIDIPGMNMPLRLHYHYSNVKKLAKHYMKTNEFPLYVGNEDFTYLGQNVGAELFMPIETKQSNWLKNAMKSKVGKGSNMLKHIVCMQLPNMVKKLYDKKYFKRGEDLSQTIPDFVDLETSKIRRSGKRIQSVGLN